MSETGESRLPPDWAQRKLAELHRLLTEESGWPASAAALTADLSRPVAPPDSEELTQMLSIVIDDALNGIDISQRYPTFYRQMLRDENVHRAFMEGLEIINTGQEITLPQAPDRDLSFLQRARSQPEISHVQANQWRVQWRKTVQQLQSLFRTGGFTVAFRDDLWLEDDGWQTLLRSEALLIGVQLDVLLEVRRPHSLQQLAPLALTVTRIRPGDQWPEAQAIIEWGNYRQTVVLGREGRTVLPPLRPEMVLDESGETFRGDLNLRLDVTTSEGDG